MSLEKDSPSCVTPLQRMTLDSPAVTVFEDNEAGEARNATQGVSSRRRLLPLGTIDSNVSQVANRKSPTEPSPQPDLSCQEKNKPSAQKSRLQLPTQSSSPPQPAVERSTTAPPYTNAFATDSPTRLGDLYQFRLPHDFKDGLRAITPETAAKLLRGSYNELIPKFIFVDCRYDFEYKGGHIKSALHIVDPYTLERTFFDKVDSDCVLIFHCEFSQERGPKMMKYMRQLDRWRNDTNYPHLFYPEMYLLRGGYSKFFPVAKDLCHPPAYVRMHDEARVKECTRWRKELRAVWNRHKTNSKEQQRSASRASQKRTGRRSRDLDNPRTTRHCDGGRNSANSLGLHSVTSLEDIRGSGNGVISGGRQSLPRFLGGAVDAGMQDTVHPRVSTESNEGCFGLSMHHRSSTVEPTRGGFSLTGSRAVTDMPPPLPSTSPSTAGGSNWYAPQHPGLGVHQPYPSDASTSAVSAVLRGLHRTEAMGGGRSGQDVPSSVGLSSDSVFLPHGSAGALQDTDRTAPMSHEVHEGSNAHGPHASEEQRVDRGNSRPGLFSPAPVARTRSRTALRASDLQFAKEQSGRARGSTAGSLGGLMLDDGLDDSLDHDFTVETQASHPPRGSASIGAGGAGLTIRNPHQYPGLASSSEVLQGLGSRLQGSQTCRAADTRHRSFAAQWNDADTCGEGQGGKAGTPSASASLSARNSSHRAAGRMPHAKASGAPVARGSLDWETAQGGADWLRTSSDMAMTSPDGSWAVPPGCGDASRGADSSMRTSLEDGSDSGGEWTSAGAAGGGQRFGGGALRSSSRCSSGSGPSSGIPGIMAPSPLTESMDSVMAVVCNSAGSSGGRRRLWDGPGPTRQHSPAFGLQPLCEGRVSVPTIGTTLSPGVSASFDRSPGICFDGRRGGRSWGARGGVASRSMDVDAQACMQQAGGNTARYSMDAAAPSSRVHAMSPPPVPHRVSSRRRHRGLALNFDAVCSPDRKSRDSAPTPSLTEGSTRPSSQVSDMTEGDLMTVPESARIVRAFSAVPLGQHEPLFPSARAGSPQGMLLTSEPPSAKVLATQLPESVASSEQGPPAPTDGGVSPFSPPTASQMGHNEVHRAISRPASAQTSSCVPDALAFEQAAGGVSCAVPSPEEPCAPDSSSSAASDNMATDASPSHMVTDTPSRDTTGVSGCQSHDKPRDRAPCDADRDEPALQLLRPEAIPAAQSPAIQAVANSSAGVPSFSLDAPMDHSSSPTGSRGMLAPGPLRTTSPGRPVASQARRSSLSGLGKASPLIGSSKKLGFLSRQLIRTGSGMSNGSSPLTPRSQYLQQRNNVNQSPGFQSVHPSSHGSDSDSEHTPNAFAIHRCARQLGAGAGGVVLSNVKLSFGGTTGAATTDPQGRATHHQSTVSADACMLGTVASGSIELGEDVTSASHASQTETAPTRSFPSASFAVPRYHTEEAAKASVYDATDTHGRAPTPSDTHTASTSATAPATRGDAAVPTPVESLSALTDDVDMGGAGCSPMPARTGGRFFGPRYASEASGEELRAAFGLRQSNTTVPRLRTTASTDSASGVGDGLWLGARSATDMPSGRGSSGPDGFIVPPARSQDAANCMSTTSIGTAGSNRMSFSRAGSGGPHSASRRSTGATSSWAATSVSIQSSADGGDVLPSPEACFSPPGEPTKRFSATGGLMEQDGCQTTRLKPVRRPWNEKSLTFSQPSADRSYEGDQDVDEEAMTLTSPGRERFKMKLADAGVGRTGDKGMPACSLDWAIRAESPGTPTAEAEARAPVSPTHDPKTVYAAAGCVASPESP